MALHAFNAFVTAGLAGATAFLCTAFITPLVRIVAIRGGWVAKPAEDRWGHRTTARLGGIAMFLGFVVAALCWIPLEPPVLTMGAAAVLVVGLGLVDDLHRLRPYTKLVGQLLIGCLVVCGGIRIEWISWPWLSIPISIAWFVFVMNAFNLLDNMDGLAAGVGAIAAVFCAIHAAFTQQWFVVSLDLVLCGVCLGFLLSNFPPAKIYMGDAGSHFLGLSLAMLALLGNWRHSTQLLSVLSVPVLVLAVPIFDTCFVTIQRVLSGQHPFTGGRDHVSHRLAVLGLSVRQTVIVLYAVSVCLGMLSIVSTNLKPLPALAIWLSVLTVLVLFGRYLAQVNVYRLEETPAHPPARKSARPETFIDTMLLHKRRLVEIVVDFSLISSVYVFAHLLRFEGVLGGDLQRLIMQSLPVILVIKLTVFAGVGLYRGVWRYVGLTDLITVLKASTLGSVLSTLALLYLWRFEGYSRAVLIIDWMLTVLAVGGSRVVERLLGEWIHQMSARGIPVLIIGAGDTGARVLRSLKDEPGRGYRIIGLLDDDASTWGTRIQGASVLGGCDQLARVLNAHHPHEVLIAIRDASGDLLQDVRACCEPLGIIWKVVSAGVRSPVEH